MTQPALLTRKDLARIIGVSVDTVERHEERWGLSGCRIKLSLRCVRYHPTRTMIVLRRLGVIQG